MRKVSSLFVVGGLIACIAGKPAANYPASVLDLTNWKLNIPLDEDKDGRSDEIKQPKLNTSSITPWFQNNEGNTGVVFRAII